MKSTLPGYGNVPFLPGQQVAATDTLRGIRFEEDVYCGKIYAGVGPGGSARLYMIAKNVSNATVPKGYVMKWDLTAGRQRKDVTIATGDTDPPAGVVCDTYGGGVDDEKYFRLVVWAEKIQLRLGTTSDTRCTIAVNGVIVSNTDDGMVWAQASAASNAAVQNRVGFALEATTNATNNGEYFDCEVNLLR